MIEWSSNKYIILKCISIDPDHPAVKTGNDMIAILSRPNI